MAFLSVLFVLTLTHLPPDAISRALPRVLQVADSDKIEHGLAYAMITLSFLFAVNCRMRPRLWGIIILGIAAIGAADEITQPLVGRDCSGWDWLADLAGIAAGCATALLICRRCRKAGMPRGPTDSVAREALIPGGHSR